MWYLSSHGLRDELCHLSSVPTQVPMPQTYQKVPYCRDTLHSSVWLPFPEELSNVPWSWLIGPWPMVLLGNLPRGCYGIPSRERTGSHIGQFWVCTVSLRWSFSKSQVGTSYSWLHQRPALSLLCAGGHIAPPFLLCFTLHVSWLTWGKVTMQTGKP